MIEFTVRGIPAAQGSKRAIVNRYTHRAQLVEDSKRTKPWRADVRAAAEDAAPARLLEGPISIDVEFRLPRPRGHYGTGRNAGTLRALAPERPTGKPDIDKLARAILDALTGTIWRDDAQVVTLLLSKHYETPGIPPGVRVRIDELTATAVESALEHLIAL